MYPPTCESFIFVFVSIMYICVTTKIHFNTSEYHLPVYCGLLHHKSLGQNPDPLGSMYRIATEHGALFLSLRTPTVLLKVASLPWPRYVESHPLYPSAIGQCYLLQIVPIGTTFKSLVLPCTLRVR